jgi:hypothetical protein
VESIPNLVGLVGVGMVLMAYLFLQVGKISSDKPTYSLINLLASSAILYSLLYEWNLPAFLMEAAWAGISAYGLWKALLGKGKG